MISSKMVHVRKFGFYKDGYMFVAAPKQKGVFFPVIFFPTLLFC